MEPYSIIILQAETQNVERTRKVEEESESDRRDKVAFVCTLLSLWKRGDVYLTHTGKCPEETILNPHLHYMWKYVEAIVNLKNH